MIRGQDPFSLTETEQAKFRNDHIGFVFQDHHLLPQWNVLENTLLPGLAQGRPDAALRERAHYLLERVGLQDRLHHLPSQLSGGRARESRRGESVDTASVVVLADEPTGNLDEENAEKVSELLLAMPREENAILIVVTHSMDLARKWSVALSSSVDGFNRKRFRAYLKPS